jgi:ribosomal protein S18 acetylase RimI-like enzyme
VSAEALTTEAASQEQREIVLTLMREHLADQLESTMALVGMTWPEFVDHYRSVGEVRALVDNQVEIGYVWIEYRERELHIHAIFVLPDFRGLGYGTQAFALLEAEFSGNADVLELGLRSDNRRALALYERLGFIAVRELPDPGYLIMRRDMEAAD